MLRSLRLLYIYTVLVLTYLGKRATGSFMHKCIFYGECIPVGMKKPALGGLQTNTVSGGYPAKFKSPR